MPLIYTLVKRKDMSKDAASGATLYPRHDADQPRQQRLLRTLRPEKGRLQRIGRQWRWHGWSPGRTVNQVKVESNSTLLFFNFQLSTKKSPFN